MVKIGAAQNRFIAILLMAATVFIWRADIGPSFLLLEMLVVAVSVQKARWVFLYFMEVRRIPAAYRVAFELWAVAVLAILVFAALA